MNFRIASIIGMLVMAASLFAQTPAPNKDVSVGLVHLIVRNPEQQKKLWVDVLGARVTARGSMELLEVPGLFVRIEKGEPLGPSEGSSLNHVGFWIKDYDEVKAKVVAAQLPISADRYNEAECAKAPGGTACQMMFAFPDGVGIEVTVDKALPTTAAAHHIHMQTPDPESARGWYARTLGATAGLRRGTIMAAMFGRGEVDFNKAAAALAPTKGRAIDRLGLEVKGLEAFCKALEAAGVKFDTPLHAVPGTKLKSALITDPLGARIELVEGLGAN
jgi:catechol 2,3-dioxygenase-like lactoylglutathione lyase family enzyme